MLRNTLYVGRPFGIRAMFFFIYRIEHIAVNVDLLIYYGYCILHIEKNHDENNDIKSYLTSTKLA